MKLKIPSAIVLLFIAVQCMAQTDTTEYLFKKVRYSYLQYHVGYSPMLFGNNQIEHGFSIQFTGVVFNDNLAIGLDFDGFVKNPPYVRYSSPHITNWMALSLSIEPLIRSRKVINFSFPVKLGYGSAQIYQADQLSYGQLTFGPRFFVCNPQAMVWVNLLKPLSLGAGVSYRLCFGRDTYTFDALSGASGYVTMRFRFDTKEYMQKAARRQQDYQNTHPQK